jgi:drug/metabolite transporter (DMT)-like permease
VSPYLLYFRLIADLGATTAATVDYLVPAFAVLSAVAVLGEPLTPHLLVGGLIIAGAIGYDQLRDGQVRNRAARRSARRRAEQEQPCRQSTRPAVTCL